MNFRLTDKADTEGTRGKAEAQEPQGKPTEKLRESPCCLSTLLVGRGSKNFKLLPLLVKLSLICPEASFKVGTKPGDTEITSQSKGKF